MHEHAAVKKNIYTIKYHIKKKIQNIGNCIIIAIASVNLYAFEIKHLIFFA